MEQGVVSSLKGQPQHKTIAAQTGPFHGGGGGFPRHPPICTTPKLHWEQDEQRERNPVYRQKGLQGGAGGLAQNKAGRVGLGSACQGPARPCQSDPPTPGPSVSAKAHSPRRRPQPSPSAWERRLFCSHLHPPPLFFSFILVRSLSELQGPGWQG